MWNSGHQESVIFFILLWAGAVIAASAAVTLCAYGGTGIVQQQPLTLGCNYTKDGSENILSFDWKHKNVLILAGSVNNQTARFQSGTGWSDSGVFQGDFTSSLTIHLPATSVVPSVAGQYTCRVTSISGAAMDTATAIVQYSPRIESTFPSNRAVTEFSHLQIHCNNFTTPGNPLTTSYTWTYGGSTISSGAVLDINNIGRDRRGQYKCAASNTVGSDSGIVIVDVLYAPQIKTTFPPSRTVTEFSRLQIDCSSYTTPGNPPTTSYMWTNGESTISSGAVLDINIVRDKREPYTCTASNTVGSRNANVTVHVQYLDRPEMFVTKTEVKENETVSLTCNVKSNPTAELEIRNVDNNTVLVERDTNRLQFTITRLQCLHNGSFLCTARNTQTGNASKSALKEINVKCSPRQDFRKKLDNTVVKHINETAALVADVIANPVPEFRWFRQEAEGLINISRHTIHSINNSRLQSVLYINISRTQDYGDYVLEMENSQGRKQFLFTLTSKGSEKSVDEEGSILPIVVGIISAVVVVAVFIVGVFLYRRKQKGLNCCKRKSEEKMEMTENRMYESSTANAGPIYAQPNKQKKANTKDVHGNAKKGRDNGGLHRNLKTQVPKVGLDDDGLTYVQIDTTNQKPAKNPKPRTTPRPTAYASISIGQVGYPLPDDEKKE